MSREIKGRFFLVGCPRSGTTLLQSLIVAHSQVASFPESKFFQKIVVPGSIYYPFNLAPRKSRFIFKQFLAELNYQELEGLLRPWAIFIPQYINSFIRALDEVSITQGKSYWLEKTPEHLRRINAIESYLKGAKFIHIVRNGTDTIASLYEMTQKYPQTWGKPRKLDRYIDRWQQDIMITSQHLHKPNHFLVRYETLVKEPETTLQGVCQFLGIPFEKSMLKRRASAAKSLVRSRERWKELNYQDLKVANSHKFQQIFSGQEQDYIVRKLEEQPWDLNNFPLSKKYDFTTDKPCRL